jgi:hypothetical protein
MKPYKPLQGNTIVNYFMAAKFITSYSLSGMIWVRIWLQRLYTSTGTKKNKKTFLHTADSPIPPNATAGARMRQSSCTGAPQKSMREQIVGFKITAKSSKDKVGRSPLGLSVQDLASPCHCECKTDPRTVFRQARELA